MILGTILILRDIPQYSIHTLRIALRSSSTVFCYLSLSREAATNQPIIIIIIIIINIIIKDHLVVNREESPNVQVPLNQAMGSDQ